MQEELERGKGIRDRQARMRNDDVEDEMKIVRSENRRVKRENKMFQEETEELRIKVAEWKSKYRKHVEEEKERKPEPSRASLKNGVELESRRKELKQVQDKNEELDQKINQLEMLIQEKDREMARERQERLRNSQTKPKHNAEIGKWKIEADELRIKVNELESEVELMEEEIKRLSVNVKRDDQNSHRGIQMQVKQVKVQIKLKNSEINQLKQTHSRQQKQWESQVKRLTQNLRFYKEKWSHSERILEMWSRRMNMIKKTKTTTTRLENESMSGASTYSRAREYNTRNWTQIGQNRNVFFDSAGGNPEPLQFSKKREYKSHLAGELMGGSNSRNRQNRAEKVTFKDNNKRNWSLEKKSNVEESVKAEEENMVPVYLIDGEYVPVDDYHRQIEMEEMERQREKQYERQNMKRQRGQMETNQQQVESDELSGNEEDEEKDEKDDDEEGDEEREEEEEEDEDDDEEGDEEEDDDEEDEDEEDDDEEDDDEEEDDDSEGSIFEDDSMKKENNMHTAINDFRNHNEEFEVKT